MQRRHVEAAWPLTRLSFCCTPFWYLNSDGEKSSSKLQSRQWLILPGGGGGRVDGIGGPGLGPAAAGRGESHLEIKRPEQR